MSLTIEKCIQAWTNSLKQMKAKADIVFYGDSLTYYGDFSKVFPNRVVCNLGLRGDTIQGMIDRVEQVVSLSPNAIFIMAGINDLGSCRVIMFREQFEHLINRVQSQLPYVKIIIQSLLPVNNRDLSISCNNDQVSACNAQLMQIAMHNNVHYLDLFSLFERNGQLDNGLTVDGIHLRKEAYNIWYEIIRTFCRSFDI